jgi:hypothetical protein
MSIAVELFAEVNERLNAGEYDAIYDLMHDNHRQYLNGSLAADGKEASRAADFAFYDMVPGVQRITHDIFGTDDRAVCRSTFRGTTTEGGVLEIPSLSMIYLREGLVAESWLYLDLSSFQ